MKRQSPTGYRHELKYLIGYPDYLLLKMRLETLMKLDEHVNGDGHYVVRSLYFDDIHNSAYQEKLQGLPDRRKYRIRIYNYSDKVIQLECKIKKDRYVRKEMAPLTRQEFNWLMNGYPRFLLDTQYDLHRIFYYEFISKILRPRVIVDYEREPYVMEAGDVRVTFDKHIRASMDDLALFDQFLSTAEVLAPGQLVMEVKYSGFLPELVRQILTSGVSNYLALSKYLMCCEKTFNKHHLN